MCSLVLICFCFVECNTAFFALEQTKSKLPIYFVKAVCWASFSPATLHKGWLPDLLQCPDQEPVNHKAGTTRRELVKKPWHAEMTLVMGMGSWRDVFLQAPLFLIRVSARSLKLARLLGGCQCLWVMWQVGEVHLQNCQLQKAQHVEGDKTVPGAFAGSPKCMVVLHPPGSRPLCSFHHKVASWLSAIGGTKGTVGTGWGGGFEWGRSSRGTPGPQRSNAGVAPCTSWKSQHNINKGQQSYLQLIPPSTQNHSPRFCFRQEARTCKMKITGPDC